MSTRARQSVEINNDRTGGFGRAVLFEANKSDFTIRCVDGSGGDFQWVVSIEAMRDLVDILSDLLDMYEEEESDD